MSCPPSYADQYTPDFTPRGQPSIGVNPATDCVAPGFDEKRARLQNATLYRSKEAGTTQDLISVQFDVADSRTFKVYYDGVLMETYPNIATDIIMIGSPSCTPLAAPDLRTQVNANSNIIEMPTIDHGGTASATPTFTSATDDDCMVAFGPTNLAGGDGPPTDASTLTSIRTGPQRSVVILRLTEIITKTPADIGQLVDPPPSRGILQFDGTDWIGYSNLVPGACPTEG